MDGLHGSDHPEFCKAWNILWINVLSVFYAPTLTVGRSLLTIDCWLLFIAENIFNDIQHLPVGAVADGMNTKLEAVLAAGLRHARNSVERGGILTHKTRLIIIRREQPGPIGTERTIEVAFDRAAGKVLVTKPDLRVVTEFGNIMGLRLTGHYPKS